MIEKYGGYFEKISYEVPSEFNEDKYDMSKYYNICFIVGYFDTCFYRDVRSICRRMLIFV